LLNSLLNGGMNINFCNLGFYMCIADNWGMIQEAHQNH
jgi:hypothetical protein